ncbi:hypothetical protein K3495_g4213 [Podosphaera aphanis]|nr:hypothetical protein K3495_g4213 [Podosphaera aphanis]
MITREWWNASRISPQPASSNSTSANGQDFAMINNFDESEPKTYNSAKLSPNWDQWNSEFEAEMSFLQENKVWDIVPRPIGRKVVGGK